MEKHSLQSLQAAQAAAEVSDDRKAEMLFDHAIYEAQTEEGPFSPQLAECLNAFAKFLESRKRFGDSMFRYKLAAAIYKQIGNNRASQEAEQNVSRMQYWAQIAEHTGHSGHSESA
ncbi:MAG TPA: hypothetical protein V6D22_15210 [Candidatus Obscuribacterales bacterium]